MVPNYTIVLLPQVHPTKQMFYYHKGTQLNKCFTTTRYPTKQMFYYYQGTQLNKCFTTTRVPN